MNERDTKIAELRDYFSTSRPNASVHTDWDFDRRCAAFRFDENHRFYLLKISQAILDDSTTTKIIAALERAEWAHVLDGLADGGVAIFTSQGFQPKASAS